MVSNKHTVPSNDSIGNMAHSPQPPPMSDTGIRINSISNTGILIHPARVPVTSNLGILIHQGQVCVNFILVVISIVIPKMYFNVSFIPFFVFGFWSLLATKL